jgi:hypothetical protein
VIAAMDVLRLGERFWSLCSVKPQHRFPGLIASYLVALVVPVLPIFIDVDDQVDKRSPTPSVANMWLYLVAMIHSGDLMLYTHTQSDASAPAPASSPIAYGTADRAVPCAIPIPGAWGSKK